jgi:hypothetical protein
MSCAKQYAIVQAVSYSFAHSYIIIILLSTYFTREPQSPKSLFHAGPHKIRIHKIRMKVEFCINVQLQRSWILLMCLVYYTANQYLWNKYFKQYWKCIKTYSSLWNIVYILDVICMTRRYLSVCNVIVVLHYYINVSATCRWVHKLECFSKHDATSSRTWEWRKFTSGFDLGRDVCFFEAFLFVFCRLLIPSFISTNCQDMCKKKL